MGQEILTETTANSCTIISTRKQWNSEDSSRLECYAISTGKYLLTFPKIC